MVHVFNPSTTETSGSLSLRLPRSTRIVWAMYIEGDPVSKKKFLKKKEKEESV